MQLYSEPQTQPLISGGTLKGRDGQSFTTPYRPGEHKGPELSFHFFNPSRVDRILCPAEFRRKLHEIDSRLEAVWHPINERWVIWFHAPREVKTPRLNGWKLIFPVQYGDGSYMPLDERTLAKVWDRTGRRFSSGVNYWDRVENEYWRDYDKKQANHKDYVRTCAGEMWDHNRIQVSMRGKSSGSKFSDHHS